MNLPFTIVLITWWEPCISSTHSLELKQKAIYSELKRKFNYELKEKQISVFGLIYDRTSYLHPLICFCLILCMPRLPFMMKEELYSVRSRFGFCILLWNRNILRKFELIGVDHYKNFPGCWHNIVLHYKRFKFFFNLLLNWLWNLNAEVLCPMLDYC